jgi:hypothetical protein
LGAVTIKWNAVQSDGGSAGLRFNNTANWSSAVSVTTVANDDTFPTANEQRISKISGAAGAFDDFASGDICHLMSDDDTFDINKTYHRIAKRVGIRDTGQAMDVLGQFKHRGTGLPPYLIGEIARIRGLARQKDKIDEASDLFERSVPYLEENNMLDLHIDKKLKSAERRALNRNPSAKQDRQRELRWLAAERRRLSSFAEELDDMAGLPRVVHNVSDDDEVVEVKRQRKK